MAQEQEGFRPLTDDELLGVAAEYPDLLNKLTSEERRRLSRLRPSAPAPEGDQLLANVKNIGSFVTDALPAIGGTVGGVLGGIGGTAFGLGFGGIPGAMGGAALGGAAGESAKQLIGHLTGGEAPETPGAAARGIGTQAALQGGLEGVGAGLTRGLTSGARAVYRGYLKPSLAGNAINKADDIVRTAMDEGLPITRSGAEKASQAITALKQQVDDILANTPGTIDLQAVANRVRSFARTQFNRLGASPDDFAAAMRVADRLDNHPSLGAAAGGPVPVSLAEANQVKRAIRPRAGDFGMERSAGRETQKVAGRMLREDIEAAAPAVGPLNARESRLIDAARAIRRAVEREANQYSLSGTKSMFSGALAAGGMAAGGLGGPATAATALGARTLLDPGVMTRATIVADRIAKELGVSASLASRLAATVLREQDAEQGETDDQN